jgi:hypothetical protein
MENSSEGEAAQRNEEHDAGDHLDDRDMSNNSSSVAGESTLRPVFSTFNITDSSNHTSGTSTPNWSPSTSTVETQRLDRKNAFNRL